MFFGPPNLFQSLCSPEESPELCHFEGEGLIHAAYLWTVKEATAKCLGTGFWRMGVEWTDVVVNPLSTQTITPSEPVRKVTVSLQGTARHLRRDSYIHGYFELVEGMGVARLHLYQKINDLKGQAETKSKSGHYDS